MRTCGVCTWLLPAGSSQSRTPRLTACVAARPTAQASRTRCVAVAASMSACMLGAFSMCIAQQSLLLHLCEQEGRVSAGKTEPQHSEPHTPSLSSPAPAHLFLPLLCRVPSASRPTQAPSRTSTSWSSGCTSVSPAGRALPPRSPTSRSASGAPRVSATSSKSTVSGGEHGGSFALAR